MNVSQMHTTVISMQYVLILSVRSRVNARTVLKVMELFADAKLGILARVAKVC